MQHAVGSCLIVSIGESGLLIWQRRRENLSQDWRGKLKNKSHCDIENGVPMPAALPQEDSCLNVVSRLSSSKRSLLAAQTFSSEIRTVQAAIAFMKSLEPKTTAKLHWRLAASALAALATRPIREGTYERANKAMRHALAAERWLSD